MKRRNRAVRLLAVATIATAVALSAAAWAAVLASPAQTPETTALAAATKTPETDELAAVKKAIAEANARFTEAQIKGDAAAVVALYCADGIQLDPRRGHMWRGRDSVEAFWTRTLKLGRPSKAVITTVSVSLMGSSATELGTFSYTYPAATPTGPPWTVEGRYAAVWRKQDDGSWKIYLDMGLPFED